MEQQNQQVIQQMKAQMAKAIEAQKAIGAKLDIEMQRAAQEREALNEQLKTTSEERDEARHAYQEEQEQRDSQTQQLMQRIAEIQIEESNAREEKETLNRQWQALLQDSQAKFSAKEQEWSAQTNALGKALEKTQEQLRQEQSTWDAMNTQYQMDMGTLREEQNAWMMAKVQYEKELTALRSEVKVMAQGQLEFKEALTQHETTRSRMEQEWAEKEKSWLTTKAEWEKTIAELEKAKANALKASAAGPGADPEAGKALAAIRQQMQEMQTLLTWLRPAKKPAFKAA